MSYTYLTPQQAADAAGVDISYFTERTIPDTMTWASLRSLMNARRVMILETQGNLVHIFATQFYYTDTGNLKRDNETGGMVMDRPIDKWVVIQ